MARGCGGRAQPRPTAHNAVAAARRVGKAFCASAIRPIRDGDVSSVTLEYEQAEEQVTELLAAIAASGMPAVFTMPNADTGNHVIREKLQQFVAKHSHSRLIDNFGIHAYFSMMSLAAAMVGNSSSGLLEAASFLLPAVNIGTRQDGRVRARNVIDVGYSRAEILRGIGRPSPRVPRVVTRARQSVRRGDASRTITDSLRTVELGDRLIRKKFYNLPVDPENDEEERRQTSHTTT